MTGQKLAKKAQQYFEESHKYYITYEDCSLTDMEYDYLCLELSKNFDKIPDEYRKHMDIDSLTAGTGFDIKLSTYKELGIG